MLPVMQHVSLSAIFITKISKRHQLHASQW